MARRAAVLVLLSFVVGCGGETPTTSGPSLNATVDLRLNAQKSGTFACEGGLFFAVAVTNPAPVPLHVDSMILDFNSSSSGCVSHPAPIDATIGRDFPAGATSEIRRIDLAGDLCSPPFGRPGCEWQATASLTTRVGLLADRIQFATLPSAPGPTPAGNPPEITRLEWTSFGNTTGGHEVPLPGDHVQTYCGVKARSSGALTVTLNYRDSASGCTVTERCWMYRGTYHVQSGESVLLRQDFRAPGSLPDSYNLTVTCTAEEAGLTAAGSMCLPVGRGATTC